MSMLKNPKPVEVCDGTDFQTIAISVTATTDIRNSVWHTLVFDLFVYVLAVLRKLLSGFTTGIFLAFPVPR